jgi:hypothetical protein
MTFSVHTCLYPVILATWGLVEWLKHKNTCLAIMRPWVITSAPSEKKQTRKETNWDIATWEAEIRRIMTWAQLRQIVLETPPFTK